MTDSLLEKFWKLANKTETCWLWTGTKDSNGYGLFYLSAARSAPQRVSVHRFAYELLVGPIPIGLELDHLCRVPACVKAVADEDGPAHLEPVTHAENMRRGNGWSGQKVRQTHCKHGHPFDEANTWIDKLGRRYCRACHREMQREVRRRRAAGTINPAANRKLTWDAVRTIRSIYVEGCVSQAALARQYGVSSLAIRKVIRNEAWSDERPRPQADTTFYGA